MTKLICDEKGRCQAHADGIPVDERCPGWCDACGQWPYATEVEEEHGGELSLCHGCAAEWHMMQAGKAAANDVKQHIVLLEHGAFTSRVTLWTVPNFRRVHRDYEAPPLGVPSDAVLVRRTAFAAVYAVATQLR